METKFRRWEISCINNLYKDNGLNNKNMERNKKVVVPNEESFAYVLNRAKAGNEMAAVQIDEWSRFCKPYNSEEKNTLTRIKKAAIEIFD